jgi:hypothetical protein
MIAAGSAIPEMAAHQAIVPRCGAMLRPVEFCRRSLLVSESYWYNAFPVVAAMSFWRRANSAPPASLDYSNPGAAGEEAILRDL